MIELKNILVATDLSECSVAASVKARELAETFGAQVHVLYVLHDAPAMVPEPMAYAGLPDIASLRESMTESLNKWTAEHFGEDSDPVRVIRTGTDFVEILNYAEEHDIDLIVVGSHGASGLEHALLGSVAERVVRRAPCPVMTVRPQTVEST